MVHEALGPCFCGALMTRPGHELNPSFTLTVW